MADERTVILAQRIAETRTQYETLKRQTEEVYQQVKTLEGELIMVMEQNNLQNFKVEGLGTFYRSERLWAKVLDLEKALHYFEEKGLSDEVFHLTPIRERLNDYMRQLLDNGESIPEGLEYSIKPQIGILGRKTKESSNVENG